jgi:hypothetical protein
LPDRIRVHPSVGQTLDVESLSVESITCKSW